MINQGRDYPSETVCLATGCGKLHVTVVFEDSESKKPIHVLATMGKAGGCASAHLSSLSESMSFVLSQEDPSLRMPFLAIYTGHDCHVKNQCGDKLARYLIQKEQEYIEGKYEEVETDE